MNDIKYYDIRDDIEKYPDAWCFLIWSKRGPGKTYSTLRMCVEDDIPFIFIKRTIEDVNLLCDRKKLSEDVSDEDLSPFNPLNRDFGWDIYPFNITNKGLAGFYHAREDDDGELKPYGKIVGWILAASAVSKYKGFSLHKADVLIFDEFIPKPWERVNKKEGDSVLDLYETVTRDRIKRGKPELKLICLANATDVHNPMFKTLQVVDIAAEMDILNREYTYLDDGTVLHFIPGDFDITDETKKTGIQKRMEGTAWGIMAYGGHFGYNDFSNIGRTSLKGYRPICSVSYQKDNFYIWLKEGDYYMTKSRHNSDRIYNLNKENDQKKFYIDYALDLREACIDGRMLFETYSMYDLIVNYRKNFSL